MSNLQLYLNLRYSLSDGLRRTSVIKEIYSDILGVNYKDIAQSIDIKKAIMTQFDLLSIKEQVVFVYYYVKGYTLQEIADEFNYIYATTVFIKERINSQIKEDEILINGAFKYNNKDNFGMNYTFVNILKDINIKHLKCHGISEQDWNNIGVYHLGDIPERIKKSKNYSKKIISALIILCQHIIKINNFVNVDFVYNQFIEFTKDFNYTDYISIDIFRQKYKAVFDKLPISVLDIDEVLWKRLRNSGCYFIGDVILLSKDFIGEFYGIGDYGYNKIKDSIDYIKHNEMNLCKKFR